LVFGYTETRSKAKAGEEASRTRPHGGGGPIHEALHAVDPGDATAGDAAASEEGAALGVGVQLHSTATLAAAWHRCGRATLPCARNSSPSLSRRRRPPRLNGHARKVGGESDTGTLLSTPSTLSHESPSSPAPAHSVVV